MPPTGALEIRERVNFATELFELGLTEVRVIATLCLPPVRPGEKDKRGKPKIGGLGLTRGQARVAAKKALHRHEVRWTANRAYDRVQQKLTLDAAMAGAMRDRDWSAVAALQNQLAKLTGTNEPEEVVISTGDVRRQYVMQMIASMPSDEFEDLTGKPPTLTLPSASPTH